MSLINQYFEKLAEEEFDVEEERELIRKAQEGDVIAFKKLRRKMDGVIKASIQKAKVTTPNVPAEAQMGAALKEFRRSIESYDGEAGAKPSTWVMGNITKSLKNLDRAYKNETRLSDSSTIELGNIESALKQLESEDGITDPEPKMIRQKIKDNFEKDIDEDTIKNLMERRRKEYSANTVVGEDDFGDSTTFGDVMDTEKITPRDHLDRANEKEKLNKYLDVLDEKDRKLYQQYRGFGDFENTGPMKLLDFAKTNDFKSEYYAKKKIKEIEDVMRKGVESGEGKG